MMKNNEGKIAILILLAIVVTIVISMLVFIIMNRGKNYKIMLFAFGKKEEMLFQEEYSISEVEDINVIATSSKVKVLEGASDKVKVTVYGAEGEKVKAGIQDKKLKVEKENNMLYILAFFFYYKEEIMIELPKDYARELQIKTSSGNIEMISLKEANIQAETSSGNITCGDIKNGDLKTTSGGIIVQDSQNLNAKSTSGNIKTGNIEQIAQIQSTSGKITTGNITEANLKTTSGNLIAENIIKGNLQTTSGKIEVESLKEGETKSTSGKIEIGETNNIIAQNTSGGIVINKVNGSCDLASKSGSIKIEELIISDNSSIKTTSGNVKVISGENMYIETSTNSGSVKINGNDRKAEVELKIQTTSGSIKIN